MTVVRALWAQAVAMSQERCAAEHDEADPHHRDRDEKGDTESLGEPEVEHGELSCSVSCTPGAARVVTVREWLRRRCGARWRVIPTRRVQDARELEDHAKNRAALQLIIG